MGAWVLAIALRPELVALVTSPADSPPDGASARRDPGSWSIWVLPVFVLRPRPREVRVVHSDVLLELLKGVVRALGQRVEARRVHMTIRVVVRHEGVGG